jgi:hypothetical protein
MTDSTAHIEEELEVTRARMDRRLSELGERLTPGQLLDDAVDYFRTSGGVDFGRNLMASVRDNPLPVAVTGIGLAWLMLSGANGSGASRDRSVNAQSRHRSGDWTGKTLDMRLGEAERSVHRESGETEPAWRDRVNAARGAVLGLARETGETAESFGQRIADQIGRASDSLRRGIHDAQDQAAAAMESVTGTARRVGDRLTGGKGVKEASSHLVTSVSDNPLLLGALALSVGALLGVVIPQSEAEEKALEGATTKVRDKLGAVTQEAIDRGTAVAEHVAEQAEASARDHGLSRDTSLGEIVEQAGSGELADAVEAVGRDALNAAEQSLSDKRAARTSD